MRLFTAASLILGLALTHGFRSKKTCGAKGLSTQIVNGEDADQCEWKWQVGLTRSSGNGLPFCGGMLVSDEWVLTAAHCCSRPDFWVVAGDWKPKQASSKKQKVRAAVVVGHPDYNSRSSEWDFAMVKLASPMNMNGCVGTVCLPSEDDAIKPGSTCWITGWGTLQSGGSQPDVLQEAKVKIISGRDCVNKFDYTASQIDDESMICAQGKNAAGNITDACQGDSGGPLVCEQGGSWYVHGATSWGFGCAGRTYPGIWARVTAARSWIDAVMSGTYTTPEPLKCPSWSAYTYPDSDGDCKCPGSKKCSVSGGSSWDCPSSSGIGGWGGRYFLPTCTDCQCYSTR